MATEKEIEIVAIAIAESRRKANNMPIAVYDELIRKDKYLWETLMCEAKAAIAALDAHRAEKGQLFGKSEALVKSAQEYMEWPQSHHAANSVIRGLLNALQSRQSIQSGAVSDKMWKESLEDLVATIRDNLLEDITDRKGWRQEWYGFDREIQREIRQSFNDIILAALQDYAPTPPKETQPTEK